MRLHSGIQSLFSLIVFSSSGGKKISFIFPILTLLTLNCKQEEFVLIKVKNSQELTSLDLGGLPEAWSRWIKELTTFSGLQTKEQACRILGSWTGRAGVGGQRGAEPHDFLKVVPFEGEWAGMSHTSFLLQYQQHMTIITLKIYPQFNISYHLSQASRTKGRNQSGRNVKRSSSKSHAFEKELILGVCLGSKLGWLIRVVRSLPGLII